MTSSPDPSPPRGEERKRREGESAAQSGRPGAERPAGAGTPGANGEAPLGEAWRARTLASQEEVLPDGHVVVTCGVPFGNGGLGRHLEEIVAALDRRGQRRDYVCNSNLVLSRGGPGERVMAAVRTPLARTSPGRRLLRARVRFDANASRQLPPADSLMAFNRQALIQFRAARALGYRSLALVTGSPHVRRVARQHGRAYEQYRLERSFGTFVVRRYLREYEQAERIYVASRYTLESFVEQGFAEERLALFPLTPHPRFRPDPTVERPSTFNVVYVGTLSVAKGVPLMIDAFRRLPHRDLRLVLVGSWKARGTRRFIEQAVAEDGRIEVSPGDPLPHLHRASLFIHPAYEDGFAYAPAEALAAGVPVLVTEDTGMKDLIVPGVTGLALPTGDLAALAEAIDAAYRREILDG